jgi:hypothetical protein
MKSVRKPHRHGGLQVRICGVKIRGDGDVVCTLPPRHGGKYHATTVLDEYNSIIVITFKVTNEEVEMWRLAGPQE